MSYYDDFPICPHCEYEHRDSDWLYNNGGYEQDEEITAVNCEKCKHKFFLKVQRVPMYETAVDEDSL